MYNLVPIIENSSANNWVLPVYANMVPTLDLQMDIPNFITLVYVFFATECKDLI